MLRCECVKWISVTLNQPFSTLDEMFLFFSKSEQIDERQHQKWFVYKEPKHAAQMSQMETPERFMSQVAERTICGRLSYKRSCFHGICASSGWTCLGTLGNFCGASIFCSFLSHFSFLITLRCSSFTSCQCILCNGLLWFLVQLDACFHSFGLHSPQI